MQDRTDRLSMVLDAIAAARDKVTEKTQSCFFVSFLK